MTQEYADIETSSVEYATRFSGAQGNWLLLIQSEHVQSCLHWKGLKGRGGLAADVGGGHGQLVDCLKEEGYQVTVIGSTAECSNLIEDRVHQGDCKFLCADLLSIPVENRAYDVVTCIRLITHCSEWKKLVGELCRISKNSVIIDYPPIFSFNFFYPLLFRLKKLLEGNTRTYALFTHHEIEREFALHGFSLQRRDGQFFLPMVFYRILKKPALSAWIEDIFSVLGLSKIFGSPTIAHFVRGEDQVKTADDSA